MSVHELGWTLTKINEIIKNIMFDNYSHILEKESIKASAPCRIDMGGTLDISTFYYPLRHFNPCTFNIAVNLRTNVALLPYKKDMVKVSSKGFESAEFNLIKAPFDHPLGLMFAISAYFKASGIHIVIDSTSPPRSGLGGSSAAVVALIAAFQTLHSKHFSDHSFAAHSKKQTAILAQAIEQSVAQVPCGFQDQLASTFGGVNAWYFLPTTNKALFKRKIIIPKKSQAKFAEHILLAYCGNPHESKNINCKWISQFVSGKNRNLWIEIISCTNRFVAAISEYNIKYAVEMIQREVAIRKEMTPDVLDCAGNKLVEAAIMEHCGARFTGAGQGGCVWAIGEIKDIDRLKTKWKNIISDTDKACLLDIKIDSKGLLVEHLSK